MHKINCLLVYPCFTSESFCNYKKTCELAGVKYPETPLGLATVAALLPDIWDMKLVDCNVEDLADKDIDQADIVFTSGMITQQFEHLKLIERVKTRNKTVVAGGPDVTSSPHVYKNADCLILGEAEITLPGFVKDFEGNRLKNIYEHNGQKADMTKTPIPRFDLIKLDRYMYVAIQFSRGCPFNCEFCDIIELFGRKPRVKNPEQILDEIQALYDLGYRGLIDLVDDNFIGNKNAVMRLLPELLEWLKAHNWPFEFGTAASLNLADDDALLDLMQEVGFSWIFMGVESPDEEVLLATQKKQNTNRSIVDGFHKIYRHGMIINVGYIVGFDSEKGSVAKGALQCIQDTYAPATMVGLLWALPNTQLSRRLKSEGRIKAGYEINPEEFGAQCSNGLNFETKRPKAEILMDFKEIVAGSFDAENYFKRVCNLISLMDCSKKKQKIPLIVRFKQIFSLIRVVNVMGIEASYRKYFWKTLIYCIIKNPKAHWYALSLIGLYAHYGPFKDFVLERVEKQIEVLSEPLNPLR